MTRKSAAFCIVGLCAVAGMAMSVSAQDSVEQTPGSGGDALSAYGTQTTRYIVDLVQFQSSWGSELAIGPVLKASNDSDVLFNTLVLGSATVSPDIETSVSLGGSYTFQRWTTRGQGISPNNASPSANINVSAVDRQFGIALSDLNANQTNVIGAVVGVNNNDVTKLYVRRTPAAHSRLFSGSADNGTLSLGAMDASGQVQFRADGFNGDPANQIIGDNIARVNLPGRNSGLNGITRSGSTNAAFDASATSFQINAGTVTTNTPALLPTSLGGPIAVVVDFANQFRADGGSGVMVHLDAAVDAHRGNPTLSTIDDLGGVATAGMLARSLAGGGIVDSINAFAVDASGTPVATISATLPSPMPGFPSLNSAGDAEFLQYLSQTSFRGPNGLVALGRDGETGNAVAAATATDPTAGDFIGVAQLDGNGVTWGVAAFIGQTVLDGPGGSPIGTLATGSPISISAPALDLLGNVYFAARYQPTVGMAQNGVFKAVRNASGYELELLMSEGDSHLGANSDAVYTIEKIVLGDSDSLASGGFNASHILQPQVPGQSTTDASSSFAFGGLVVGATITYNNLGTSESYESLLFVGPYAPPTGGCPGDVNGDNRTDLTDFSLLAQNFGATGLPHGSGESRTLGDLNDDGSVNLSDFTILAQDFGCVP